MYDDFKELLSTLKARSVKYLVVWICVHTQPRATKDIDLLVKPDSENGWALYAVLAEFGGPFDGLVPEDFIDLGEISGEASGLTAEFISSQDLIASKITREDRRIWLTWPRSGTPPRAIAIGETRRSHRRAGLPQFLAHRRLLVRRQLPAAYCHVENVDGAVRLCVDQHHFDIAAAR
jgi:hypothetical protein